MPYQPGDILYGKYRIESLLGAGAFGDVYRVTHLELNVLRALKIMRHDAPGIGSSDFNNCTARFKFEAQLGAKLNTPTPHPNLLQVHDFKADGDLLVLEMEYASGGSLLEWMQRYKDGQKTIPLDGVLKIALDVSDGLSAIHAFDIVHRDLKPSNILFDNLGHAKVSDLGLAQMPGGPSRRSQLSTPQAHPGTPGYMSPEQEHGQGYLRPASDIYSLGIVLFEMLTGRNYTNLEPGTRASSLRADIPHWLDELLVGMLAENPKQRPWDGRKLADLIRARKQGGVENAGREKLDRESIERVAVENAKQEKARSDYFESVKREEQQSTQSEKPGRISPETIKSPRSALSNATPLLLFFGVIGIIITLFWIGSMAVELLTPVVATATFPPPAAPLFLPSLLPPTPTETPPPLPPTQPPYSAAVIAVDNFFSFINNAQTTDDLLGAWNLETSHFQCLEAANCVLATFQKFWIGWKVQYSLYDCGFNLVDTAQVYYPRDSSSGSSPIDLGFRQYQLTEENGQLKINSGTKILSPDPACPLVISGR